MDGKRYALPYRLSRSFADVAPEPFLKALNIPASRPYCFVTESGSGVPWFDSCGEYIFICFANGKMEIYNKGTQAPVRKPIAAHGSEIKFIAKGRNGVAGQRCATKS